MIKWWEWLGIYIMRDDKTMHDVLRGSNLDLILRGTIGALNRFTDVLGGGLQAIALALSNPKDNSAEVQKKIDAFTQDLKSSTDMVEQAINEDKGA